MVDLVTFVTTNFISFFGLGSSILIALVCFLLYNKTGNGGFITIIIGLAVSIGWRSIYLFILGGGYLYENLYNANIPLADIQIILMVVNGIGLVISAIGTLTLIIGLWIIANELPKKSYNAIQ